MNEYEEACDRCLEVRQEVFRRYAMLRDRDTETGPEFLAELEELELEYRLLSARIDRLEAIENGEAVA